MDITRDEFDGLLTRLNALEKSQPHVPDISGLREELEDLSRSILEIKNRGGVSRRDVQAMVSESVKTSMTAVAEVLNERIPKLRREMDEAMESAVSTSKEALEASKEALESRTNNLVGEVDRIRSQATSLDGTLKDEAAILRREMRETREASIAAGKDTLEASKEALEARTRSLVADVDSIRSSNISETVAIETVVSSLSAFYGN